MPLKEWGFTNYGQAREISVTEEYEENRILGLGIKKGAFEWLTGHDYNHDGGTYRTLNAFSKVAEGRNALNRKDDDELTGIRVPFMDYVNGKLNDKRWTS